MPDLIEKSPRLLLDACSALSIYGTGHMAEILSAQACSVAIVNAVEAELKYVKRGGTGTESRDRVPVDLRLFKATRLLAVVTTETDAEASTYISLALEIGSGEAMSGAIAFHRGHHVITDDLAASTVLMNWLSSARVHTTAWMIRHWAEHTDQADVRGALRSAAERADYQAPLWDPLRDWWERSSQ